MQQNVRRKDYRPGISPGTEATMPLRPRSDHFARPCLLTRLRTAAALCAAMVLAGTGLAMSQSVPEAKGGPATQGGSVLVTAAIRPLPRPALGAFVLTASEGSHGRAGGVAEGVSDGVSGGVSDGTTSVPRWGPVTNLPLPRYVSLKTPDVNARRGPSLSNRIDWVFRHRDMPLRITAEFGHWRRVEDRDGAGGWIHYSLLSGARTVVIEGGTTEGAQAAAALVDLRAKPDPDAEVVARAETGVIAELDDCLPDWCRIDAGDARGWIAKSAIWGVDPDELRD